ncbi:hypothetical protein EV363DRAFT_343435 [Boletus edulis]|nr:hypothetical protein EV363DRAFT_343435 [Boletus edulis]
MRIRFLKLEYLGDAARHAGQHVEAISVYSAALSLDPSSQQGLIVRSKAYIAGDLLEDGFKDANETRSLVSMGLREQARGFTQGRTLRRCSRRYFNHLIERFVPSTVESRDSQGSSECHPGFTPYLHSHRLCSSSWQVQYYRYATFSHTWGDNEPLFDESFTHNKLQMFCKISQDAELHWAWSDTCCINKADHFVLQEVLVAMFKWYEGSAVTIIFLRGVRSPTRRGGLMRSLWNTQAWTRRGDEIVYEMEISTLWSL